MNIQQRITYKDNVKMNKILTKQLKSINNDDLVNIIDNCDLNIKQLIGFSHGNSVSVKKDDCTMHNEYLAVFAIDAKNRPCFRVNYTETQQDTLLQLNLYHGEQCEKQIDGFPFDNNRWHIFKDFPHGFACIYVSMKFLFNLDMDYHKSYTAQDGKMALFNYDESIATRKTVIKELWEIQHKPVAKPLRRSARLRGDPVRPL